MKKISKIYEVFTYDELTDTSKNKAIEDYINFVIEVIPYNNLSEDMKKAIIKSEDMKTPWFVGSYIYEYAKIEIIENLKEYDFLENGTIFQMNSKIE